MNTSDQQYQQIIEKAFELGRQNEMKYFGCSQAVVSALIEAFGIGGPDILRSSTCFSGGVARRGNVCGAVTGGLMMIGFLIGRDDLEMFEQLRRAMGFGDTFYRRFEEKFGTAICAEIQKVRFGKVFDMVTEEGREAFNKAGAHDPEGCPVVTGEGARLAAEIMIEILKDGHPVARMMAQGA
jgi:C_GCAxxG_C_C family probable redox protein